MPRLWGDGEMAALVRDLDLLKQGLDDELDRDTLSRELCWVIQAFSHKKALGKNYERQIEWD